MIQRIQTLYLLVTAALVATTLFTPLASFFSDAGSFELHAFSFRAVAGDAHQNTFYLGLLLAAACLLPVVTIFCFRNRMLQIRLCGVELVLLLGDLVFIAIYCWLALRASGGEWSLIAASLRVPAVLVAMAMRSIFRDEILVRSLDRIR